MTGIVSAPNLTGVILDHQPIEQEETTTPIGLPMDEEQQQVEDTPAREEGMNHAMSSQDPAPQMATQTTRSSRNVRPTKRKADSLSQREQGLMAWEVLMDQDKSKKAPTVEMQYYLQQVMSDPIAFAALANPDVLYIHKAMKALDRDKFINATGIN